jgi:putative ABC transport system substrate-binding protein
MKIIINSRKYHYLAIVSTFLITVALIAGIVGCSPTPTPTQYNLTISSTEGGSVTTPGQGTGSFTYDEGEVVNLVAEPDEGYRFENWTGDVGTVANVNAPSSTITMQGNYFITANFEEEVTPKEEVYKIGITQICTHPAIDSCREGFIDQMAEEGYIEGENVEYIQRNAELDEPTMTTIAEYFVSEEVDLIFSLATLNTLAVAAAVEGTDIPVVFAAVNDPVDAGLADSWEEPGGQITGSSDWVDVEAQVQLDMDIYPAERLGTIYNTGESFSVWQLNELKAVAESLGITEIVEATVASTADVLAAAESLVGRVDAIWEPASNTVAGAIDSVVQVCEDNDIPLFCTDDDMAEAGAISGYGFINYDYYVNGQTAGELAARVLEGEDPGTISVVKTPMTIVYLCPAAAERMGVTIPPEVLDTATKVCEE